jgi:hypothetical protein
MNSHFIFKKVFLLLILLILFGCSKGSDPTPPEPSILSEPINGENCKTGDSINDIESSVQFSWSNTSEISYHILEIKNLETGEQLSSRVIPNEDSKSKLIYSTVTLDKGHAYQWQVISFSDNFPENSPSSDIWRFYLQGDAEQNGAPFTANLISPQAGEAISLNNNGYFNIMWEGVDPDGDSLIYTLYLDKIDGKQSPPEAFINLGSESILVELELNEIYYWRVFSEDPYGNNSMSQIQSFRVID